MGTLVLTDPSNGTTADASLIANNNSAIKTVVNGGIDNSNISASAGISASKLSGLVNYAGALASASTISPTTGRNVVHTLTGTTTVNTITAGTAGDILTLIASGQSTGVCVILGHRVGNVNMRGGRALGLYAQVPADTGAGQGESITLLYDGTYWSELTSDLRIVLDYQQITSNATSTSTTEAGAGTAITASAITFDGATPILFEVFGPSFYTTGVNQANLSLHDGSAFVGQLAFTLTGVAATQEALFVTRRYVVAAGSKTFTARIWTSAAANTATLAAGSGAAGNVAPAYMMIKRSV